MSERTVAVAAVAPAPSIVHLREVDSTQTRVFALAAEGAADGTVVLADVQHAGRGRRGRTWTAAPGESLLASILCRPRLPISTLPLLSLTAAVAVAETLEDIGVSARIKWPNDVLARGRKIAGILLESRLGLEPVVAVGIGINAHQRTFGGALAGRATSIFLETARPPEVREVLVRLVARFAGWRARLADEGFAPVRERWRALTSTLGTRVSIDGITGVARDLDAEGALVLEAEGRLYRMVAGEMDDAARR